MNINITTLRTAILVSFLGFVITSRAQTYDELVQNFSQTFTTDGDPGLFTCEGCPTQITVADGKYSIASAGSRDLRWNNSSDNSNDVLLNPTEDVFLAVKYVGSNPNPESGNDELQYRDVTATWKTKIIATETFATDAGNEVTYFELVSGDIAYTGDSYTMNRFNVFHRSAESPYVVDWLATFTSVDDIKAAAALSDDGPDDEDEVIPVRTELTVLTVDGVSLIPGFAPVQTSYETFLTEGTTVVPNVVAVAEDPNASIKITPASELPGTTTVTVTSSDGMNSNTYSILFRVYETQDTDRPNIIYLMTDDQRWDNMGCYGRPEFDTPNIDALADEGVVFDNAAYAVAICMPSRVTMLTGRYLSTHQTGFAAPNNLTHTISDFENSYPAKLKEAGYRTGFIGKVHITFTDERESPTHSHPADYKYQNTIGHVFDFFAGAYETTGNGVETWPEGDLGLQHIYESGRSVKERTLKTGDAMLRFIDTQPADEPFCLTTFFYAVKHDGNEYPTEHFDLFKDLTFSVPENYVEGPNYDLPQVVQDYARGFSLHVQRTATLSQYQGIVQKFATQGYSVDAQVGKLVAKLEERGMLDNTIIIYSSDNGRFQGSHGLYDKALLYEESIKQPLIVFDGRKAAAERNRREDALISSVDIAPTILSMAGVEAPETMQGSDFTGILDQTQDMSQWQNSVFIEDLFLNSMIRKTAVQNETEVAAGKSYRAHGVRTEKWKYFVYYEQDPLIEELYDLENDSLEQTNLVDSVSYQDVLNDLREQTEVLYAKARGLETDCNGDVGGDASVDPCGACSGGNTGIEPSSSTVWYEDSDGDGVGDATASVSDCNQPTGYVDVVGDECPDNGDKLLPGECGCKIAEGECSVTLDAKTLLSHISLYPNPTKDQIMISNGGGSLVEIYNINGALELTFQISDDIKVISLANLDPGIHILRFTNSKETVLKRLIKE